MNTKTIVTTFSIAVVAITILLSLSVNATEKTLQQLSIPLIQATQATQATQAMQAMQSKKTNFPLPIAAKDSIFIKRG